MRSHKRSKEQILDYKFQAELPQDQHREQPRRCRSRPWPSRPRGFRPATAGTRTAELGPGP